MKIVKVLLFAYRLDAEAIRKNVFLQLNFENSLQKAPLLISSISGY